MVFNTLIAPVLERFGAQVAGDIVRGFEEFRFLEDIAAEATLRQLRWAANFDEWATRGQDFYRWIGAGEIVSPCETFVEVQGERSTTHVHDDDRLLVIEQGEMEFWNGIGGVHQLAKGDILLIPRYCLHGSTVTSNECIYDQPIVPARYIDL